MKHKGENNMMEENKLYTEEELQEMKEKWKQFKNNIIYENRFFSGNEILKILDKIKKIEEKNDNNDNNDSVAVSMKGTLDLYRARIGSYIDKDDKEMFNPPPKITNTGRCNPKGISYLYLASNKKTAVQEVRPSVGDQVTVAKFKVSLENIFSFAGQIQAGKVLKNGILKSPDVQALVKIINDDFSKVITLENKLEYTPYQFIAEYIKNRGFDCFVFESSLGGGFNFVVFDPSKAKIVNINDKELYKIEKNTCETEPEL